MIRKRMMRGFTLGEALVVLAIIGLLSATALTFMGTAREKARDTQRLSDLQQLRTALRLYAEDHGEYPCEDAAQCTSSVQTDSANGEIGVGNHIDTLLAPYLSSTIQDPRSGEARFAYYYDGQHNCSGLMGAEVLQSVLFARTMEVEANRNMVGGPCDAGDVATDYEAEGRLGSVDAHYIFFGLSPDSY